DVGRRHEMPGRTHHVSAEDPPLLEGTLDVGIRTVRQAKSEPPLCGFVLLGLDGAQPFDDLFGLAMPCTVDALVQKTTFGNRFTHDWCSFSVIRGPQSAGCGLRTAAAGCDL